MSTRCQIEFKHIYQRLKKKKPIVERRTIYRHSDGYPEGVVPDLQEFYKWNLGRNGDIEYQVANFIYWSKRWYEEHYFNKDYNGKIKNVNAKWHNLNKECPDNLHIGFGVCENDEFHGDIEYFYELIREEVQVDEVKFSTKTYLLVYKVESKDYSKPITRKNLKQIDKIYFEGKNE